MDPDTRSSRPKIDPDNGLSRWDNEGGAPPKGDRSRRLASKTERPRLEGQGLEGQGKSKGGIIIPDTVKEKPQEGEIVATGPGARDESGIVHSLGVKPGDHILFGKWSGAGVKVDGEELLIMKETDVMGVVEGVSADRMTTA